ncbi:MAG: hypothetical protein AAFO69_15915 [Bacteroidota bacterium]
MKIKNVTPLHKSAQSAIRGGAKKRFEEVRGPLPHEKKDPKK